LGGGGGVTVLNVSVKKNQVRTNGEWSRCGVRWPPITDFSLTKGGVSYPAKPFVKKERVVFSKEGRGGSGRWMKMFLEYICGGKVDCGLPPGGRTKIWDNTCRGKSEGRVRKPG